MFFGLFELQLKLNSESSHSGSSEGKANGENGGGNKSTHVHLDTSTSEVVEQSDSGGSDFNVTSDHNGFLTPAHAESLRIFLHNSILLS